MRKNTTVSRAEESKLSNINQLSPIFAVDETVYLNQSVVERS